MDLVVVVEMFMNMVVLHYNPFMNGIIFERCELYFVEVLHYVRGWHKFLFIMACIWMGNVLGNQAYDSEVNLTYHVSHVPRNGGV